MACVQFANFAFAELASPVGITDTAITVTSTSSFYFEGAQLGAGDWFYVRLTDANSFNNGLNPPAKYEFVKVTGVDYTNHILTVVRAADYYGANVTTAQVFDNCDYAVATINAAVLYDLEDCAGGTGTGATGPTGPTGATSTVPGPTGPTGATGSGGGGTGTTGPTGPTGPGAGSMDYEIFLASGDFNPPAGTSGGWVDIYAGGAAGGGGGASPLGGPGGGAGEYCEGKLVAFIGATIAVVVGAGGVPGARSASGSNGATGGDSSFGTWTVKGGNPTSTSGNVGGFGGGVGGSTVPTGAVGAIGVSETPSFYGGSSGGSRGKNGGGSGGFIIGGTGSASHGGGGGATPLGQGGAGGGAAVDGVAAADNSGAGGGGGGFTAAGTTGGTGGSGKVIVYWIA